MLRATGCASMAENSKYAAVNYKYGVPRLTYAPLHRRVLWPVLGDPSLIRHVH